MSKKNEQHKTRMNCFILDILNLNTLNLLYFLDLILILSMQIMTTTKTIFLLKK